MHTSTNDAASKNIALTSAVVDCNQWLPDLFISTGDAGDNTLATVQKSFSIMNTCERPVHVVIGNHDEWESPSGTPQTDLITGVDCFNRPAPFYYSAEYLNALLLFLDCNFYAGAGDEYHQPGDRIGHYAEAPGGGDPRLLPQSELDWIEAQMAASAADYILVFVHYPPGTQALTNHLELSTLLVADGRPVNVFCGHVHENARTFSSGAMTWYKVPALQESISWARVIISETGAIENMIICNYTDPGGWTINIPFELRQVSAALAMAIGS